MIGDYPKQILDLLTQELASTGRIPGTRWITSPDVGSVLAGQDSITVPILFPMRGIVLALYGQTVSATPSANSVDYAGVRFRLQVGGTEDLILDGRGGPSFLPMLGAFGGVANWMPLLRTVEPGVNWQLTFRNRSAVTQTPEVDFTFIADADIARMAARR